MQANGRNSVEALTLRASQLFKDEPVICGKVLAAIVKLREDSARALLAVDDHAILEVALKDLAQPNEGPSPITIHLEVDGTNWLPFCIALNNPWLDIRSIESQYGVAVETWAVTQKDEPPADYSSLNSQTPEVGPGVHVWLQCKTPTALKKRWWMLLLPSAQQQQHHSQLSAPVHLAPSELPEGGTTPTPRPGADGGLPEALVIGLQMAAIGLVKHEALHFARWAICGKLLPKGLRIAWGVSSRHLPQIAGKVVGLLRRSGVIPV